MRTAEPTELFDLRMSEEARPLYDRVVRFLEDVVAPMQEEFFRLGEGRADRWSYAPGQLEALEGAKTKAKVVTWTSTDPTKFVFLFYFLFFSF